MSQASGHGLVFLGSSLNLGPTKGHLVRTEDTLITSEIAACYVSGTKYSAPYAASSPVAQEISFRRSCAVLEAEARYKSHYIAISDPALWVSECVLK